MAKDFKNALNKIERVEPKETKEETPKATINPEELTKANLELMLIDFKNDAKESFYTLKATKPILDFLKGLATVEKTTIKDLMIEALLDYIRKAPKDELEKALEYKTKYLD